MDKSEIEKEIQNRKAEKTQKITITITTKNLVKLQTIAKSERYRMSLSKLADILIGIGVDHLQGKIKEEGTPEE